MVLLPFYIIGQPVDPHLEIMSENSDENPVEGAAERAILIVTGDEPPPPVEVAVIPEATTDSDDVPPPLPDSPPPPPEASTNEELFLAIPSEDKPAEPEPVVVEETPLPDAPAETIEATPAKESAPEDVPAAEESAPEDVPAVEESVPVQEATGEESAPVQEATEEDAPPPVPDSEPPTDDDNLINMEALDETIAEAIESTVSAVVTDIVSNTAMPLQQQLQDQQLSFGANQYNHDHIWELKDLGDVRVAPKKKPLSNKERLENVSLGFSGMVKTKVTGGDICDGLSPCAKRDCDRQKRANAIAKNLLVMYDTVTSCDSIGCNECDSEEEPEPDPLWTWINELLFTSSSSSSDNANSSDDTVSAPQEEDPCG